MYKYLIYYLIFAVSPELNLCDAPENMEILEICLYDHWVNTSPNTAVQPGGTFAFVSVPADNTLTAADLAGPNPCVEFDGEGCGIWIISYTAPIGNCTGCPQAVTTRRFRQCCLTSTVICN